MGEKGRVVVGKVDKKHIFGKLAKKVGRGLGLTSYNPHQSTNFFGKVFVCVCVCFYGT